MVTCSFRFLSHEQSNRTRNKRLIKAQKLPVLVFKVTNEAKKAAKVLHVIETLRFGFWWHK